MEALSGYYSAALHPKVPLYGKRTNSGNPWDENISSITVQNLGGPNIAKSTLAGMERYAYQNIAKARNYIRTIDDLVYYYYPTMYKQEALSKAADPLLTTTTGAYNQIYGPMVWVQINLEANAFGFLSKQPWDRSGWRAITAAAATSGGGVAENSYLPDTIKPTIAQIYTKPKVVATTFSVSALEQELGLAGGDDMFEDPKDFLRQYSAVQHRKLINYMLLADVAAGAAGNNVESIDRVCCSASEVTGCSITSGYGDIYGLSRGSASWADAYVNHNSGTLRKLTLDLVDSMFQNTYPYKDPNDRYCILTGYDTFEVIQRLRSPYLRFEQVPESQWIRPSVNGVQAVVPGVEGGFVVTTYRGVPILVSNDVKQDTSGLSRIYLLNLDNIFFKVIMPTLYFETGYSTGQPFAINQLADEGLFTTMGELIATKFKVHAKVRDIKA